MERVLIDDYLLIEELTVGLGASDVEFATSTSWYFRACRAAVLGAGGYLSGPFKRIGSERQARAIEQLLRLRDDISLPDPRRVVATMVGVARRHPRLNVLNLEATAAALDIADVVWLSAKASAGVLPEVLDGEGIRWRVRRIDTAHPPSSTRLRSWSSTPRRVRSGRRSIRGTGLHRRQHGIETA